MHCDNNPASTASKFYMRRLLYNLYVYKVCNVSGKISPIRYIFLWSIAIRSSAFCCRCACAVSSPVAVDDHAGRLVSGYTEMMKCVAFVAYFYKITMQRIAGNRNSYLVFVDYGLPVQAFPITWSSYITLIAS